MKIRKKDFEYLKNIPEVDKDIIREIIDEEVVKDEKVNIIHAEELKEQALEIAKDPYKIRGLATGYPNLDKMLCGLDAGELGIVAGETSVGKSLFAVNIVAKAYSIKPTFTTLFFTLEMPIKSVLARFMMIDSDITERPLFFFDNKSGANIPKVKKAIAMCQDKWGLDLVVIDHLHYFPMARDNQAAEIARITREIKGLAIEFNIPIILLSHLRRKPAGAGDREPSIDDLKDSSSIGQDADMVIMLRRDDTNQVTRNLLNVYVRKNRNKGRTGTQDMMIDFKTLTISELPNIEQSIQETFELEHPVDK